MEQQLNDVEKKIDEVEKGISVLRSARPEGWQDELAYLRGKEKQLHEEKRQLREEKKQLREKEEQPREKKLLLLRKSDTLQLSMWRPSFNAFK